MTTTIFKFLNESNFTYLKIVALFLIAIFISFQNTNAEWGNEWINYEKNYYKFTSDQEGIHRLTFETLSESGISLVGKNFKLFSDGQQIPIFTSADGQFVENDYIEFFGTANDGKLDLQLYENASTQAHPDRSLFTDNRTYYLVSENDEDVERFETIDNNLIGNSLVPETHFYYNSKVSLFSSFHSGTPILTSVVQSNLGEFSEGESWVGSIFKSGNDYNVRVPTPSVYQEFNDLEDVEVEIKVVGRNHSIGVIEDKEIEILVNDKTYIKDVFKRYDLEKFKFNLRPTEISTEPSGNLPPKTKLTFKAFDGEFGGFTYETKYSVASASIKYPRSFNFDKESFLKFDLDINEEKYFELNNFDVSGSLILYDITNKQRLQPLVDGNKIKFKLSPTGSLNTTRTFVIANSSSEIITIDKLEEFRFIDYSKLNKQGNFVIITNEELLRSDAIKAYTFYRNSDEGGNYSISVISVEQLYEQFAFGISHHPLAIKNFINYVIDQWKIKPEYLLLIGKSITYDKFRFEEDVRASCFVPTYGHTGSDCILTSKTGYDYLPQLKTGRLPVNNSGQIADYLDKLKEYESIFKSTSCDPSDRAWMRKALHVSKGWGVQQTELFTEILDFYTPNIVNPPSNMILESTLEDDAEYLGGDSDYDPSPEFEEVLESGINLINYFGHGIDAYWQFDINRDPQFYQNKGKYPFFLSNACSVGNIHKDIGNETMVEDYVLAKDAGAIAFFASTSISSAGFINLFTTQLLDNLMNVHYGEPITESIKQTIHDIYKEDDGNIRKVSTEFTFVGDPAVRLYQWKNPEMHLYQDIEFGRDTLPYEEDSLKIKFALQNSGKGLNTPVEVSLFQYKEDSLERKKIWSQNLMTSQYIDTFEFNILIPKDLRFAGLNEFSLVVDPDLELTEDCVNNNDFYTELYLYGCSPNCPIDTMAIDTTANDTTVIDSTSTGFAIIDFTNDVSIYPNPTKGKLNIVATEPIAQLSIVDINGFAVVNTKNLDNSSKMELDLPSILPGIYFVKIQTKSKTFVRKLVKEL